MDTENDISIYCRQANNMLDVSELSSRSSVPIIATCPQCEHSWQTCKRNLSNGYLCPQCKAQNKSFWHTDAGKALIPLLLNKEDLASGKLVTAKSARLLDFRCPDCGLASRRSIRSLNTDYEKAQHFCKECHPEHRVKSGVLFLANHPELLEQMPPELQTQDTFLQSREKYSFLHKCGHYGTHTPRTFLTHVDVCADCEASQKQAWQDYVNSLPVRSDGHYGYPCSECGEEYFISLNRLQRLYKAHGKSMCQDCVRFTKGNPRLDSVMRSWTDVHWAVTNTKDPHMLTTGSAYRADLECSNNHHWSTFTYAITGHCPICYSSTLQNEIRGFLDEIGVEYVENDRQQLAPLELDFFIPSLSIGIEVNGVYWHSSKNVHHTAHHNKWKAAENKSISLLVVWEDDWYDKQDVVKSALAHKLNKSTASKVYARQTEIKIVSNDEAQQFMDSHHIQGHKNSSQHFALIHQDSIVAVMSVGIAGDTAMIERYATSMSVPGGFTKLLKRAKSNLPANVTSIITYSDNSISDGTLYDRSGFEMVKHVRPSYSYLVKKRRVHKFNYRKQRFQTDENLLWEEGLTESELAELNNLWKIYDYGKRKWVFTL